MPLLLPAILANRQKPHCSLVLLQSCVAQPALPILRELVNAQPAAKGCAILVCALHQPAAILTDTSISSRNVHVLDWTSYVPGYGGLDFDAKLAQVRQTAENAPPGPITIVFDSIDTLNEDFESTSVTYKYLLAVLSIIRTRPVPSRLICHVTTPSPLIQLLKQITFSPSLTHLIAHPPVLLSHIASTYLTYPPPTSSPEKFWRIFVPISERHHEVEKLVYGSGGEGGSGDDIVVEILVRGGSGGESHGKRKYAERALEGWCKGKGGPCDLSALDSIKGLLDRNASINQEIPDPTRNLPFNLGLTSSQQESRSQVPLPYAHDGKAPELRKPSGPGQIFYDPDSADDLDDEDPDEDLDI